ncbi:MAG: GTPase Era [Polyangiaceae bacterium]|nr:GTPase Era [Polyangiaceae bacterium]
MNERAKPSATQNRRPAKGQKAAPKAPPQGKNPKEASRKPAAHSPAPPAKKAAAPKPAVIEGPLRSGTVALIGRPNVGKSTLLNAALGQPLAIVSPTPQTTRDTLLGVLHRGSAEFRLLDTPGLHKPKTELGRVMNAYAREAARAADVVLFITDVPQRGHGDHHVIAPHPGDLTLLQSLKDAEGAAPVVLVLNKVDIVRDKSVLLPLIEAFSKILPFAAIVPISAKREGEVERVLAEVGPLLPEGKWQHDEDDLTDRPTRYFASEYVREQILRATRLEVPHATAVTVDKFSEPERGALEIDITIHVERPGQKKILVGKGGATLKQIGMQARLRVEEMVGRKVILRTWVRVTEAWRQSRERLSEMGYEKDAGGDQTLLIEADLPDLSLPTDGEPTGPVVIAGDEDQEQ